MYVWNSCVVELERGYLNFIIIFITQAEDDWMDTKCQVVEMLLLPVVLWMGDLSSATSRLHLAANPMK